MDDQDAINSVEVIGHSQAKAQLDKALQSDKVHHGWMLTGPRGIGKFRLARLIACALLSGNKSLDASQIDPKVLNLVETGSHPDCRIVQRPVDDKGKQKSEIPVSSVRSLVDFFSLRPAMGGWRICIIDSIDEMNRSGANALLKTLEEPPEKSLFILVSHGEGVVLPTIKSRCRKLAMQPLSESETVDVLKLSGFNGGSLKTLAKSSEGRPGKALSRADKDVQSAMSIAQRMAETPLSRGSDTAKFLSAVSKSDVCFDAAMDVFLQTSRSNAVNYLAEVQFASVWAKAHRDLVDLIHETKDLNMDKSQAASSGLAMVQRAAAKSREA